MEEEQDDGYGEELTNGRKTYSLTLLLYSIGPFHFSIRTLPAHVWKKNPWVYLWKTLSPKNPADSLTLLLYSIAIWAIPFFYPYPPRSCLKKNPWIYLWKTLSPKNPTGFPKSSIPLWMVFVFETKKNPWIYLWMTLSLKNPAGNPTSSIGINRT